MNSLLFKMKLRTFITLVFLTIPALLFAAPPIDKGQRVVTAGHSFHIFTAKQVAELAQQAGLAGHELAALQMLGGSRVINHWELTGDKATARKAIEAGGVDVVTLSPHLKIPDEGIDRFTDLALAKNANARVIVQASWIPWDAESRELAPPDRNTVPLESLTRLAERYAEACRTQARAINARVGREVVSISPVGAAVARLRELVRAGKVPGVTKDDDLFSDAMGHGRIVIEHLASYVTFAAIYRRDPSGPAQLRAERGEKTTPELQRLLQRIAWECVLAEPMSGVDKPAAYDPLRAAPSGTSAELKFTDEKRARELPLLVYLPADTTKPAPVLLFSHGLGGSRNGSAFLGKHWSARGYAAVFLQHPGSDEGVWRDVPAPARMEKLKDAASAENFALRTQDVVAVLDQLTLWHKEKAHVFEGRLDMDHVGMSGHSFGAVTTQAVSGQSFPLVGMRFTDYRIRAAASMSHSPPRRGDAAPAFGSVKIPWMLMTGTKDDSIVASFTPSDRAKVFDALPPGGKYELVLNNAEHSAFTERALPGDKEPRNPSHHRVILALTTAFFDAHLRGDTQAKAWLEGDGPRGVMEKEDTLRKK